MSLKNSKKVDTNRYELEISIDAESFQNAIKDAYRKNRSKINVPGFRKGKAPLSIIEKFYGEEVFYEDALNLLYSDALDSAVNEAGLRIIEDKIDFDLVSISKAEGVDFKSTITTYPEVEMGEYKGLKAEKVIPQVTDAEIDEEINRMKEEAAANAAADAKEKERIDKINQADSMIFQVEKSLKDLGDKIPADKKSQIEGALAKLKEAHKNQDIDAIDASMKELETVFHAASQDIYNAQQQAGAQQQGPQPGANPGAQQGGNNGDNVTDVPFEEV